MELKPKVIISKCLEHGHCRYDGSMISSEVVKAMIPFVEFIPICPEMAIGLGVPRDSIRLIDVDGSNHLIGNKTAVDYTEAMLKYVNQVAKSSDGTSADGFILKSRSPSCGIKDVKLYKTIGKAPCINKSSKGIFGGNIMAALQGISFEDEGRLTNFDIREHFYTAIFTRSKLRAVMSTGSMKALINFHSKNKYLFMAYSQKQLKVLGKIVANHDQLAVNQVMVEYFEQFNKLFGRKPTPGQYTNVLLHVFGYFSDQLSVEEKSHFIDALTDYRHHYMPLSSILVLLKSWVTRFDLDYLKSQSLFQPYPHELIQVRDSGKVV